MICSHCNKELPKGVRHTIPNTPKLARFCGECHANWLAGSWKLKDIFIRFKGSWTFKNKQGT